MNPSFQPLAFHAPTDAVGYFSPRQTLPERVTLTAPALEVMTDFSLVTAHTTGLATPIDRARETMIARGVRLLLVCDDTGAVRGLITSRDIDGERPRRLLEKSHLTREELLVRDVMTLKGRLDVLAMEDVARARVGDIIATLRQVDRQHAMVVDRDPTTGRQAVRGVFSVSQIARQLGLTVDPAAAPLTASKLDALLADDQGSSPGEGSPG
ncbi:MAG: CBS domain-containing protein [Candidatus Competibacterales bacterium]